MSQRGNRVGHLRGKLTDRPSHLAETKGNPRENVQGASKPRTPMVKRLLQGEVLRGALRENAFSKKPRGNAQLGLTFCEPCGIQATLEQVHLSARSGSRKIRKQLKAMFSQHANFGQSSGLATRASTWTDGGSTLGRAKPTLRLAS